MRISDWSSDVCSSDLPRDTFAQLDAAVDHRGGALRLDRADIGLVHERQRQVGVAKPHREGRGLDQPRPRLERRHRLVALATGMRERSAGRRVGKEGVSTWRSRWSPYPSKINKT